MLMQNKVHKALRGEKPINIDEGKCNDMKVVTFSIIWMSLTDLMIYNMVNEETIHDLWLKLESMFMSKNIKNKLFMKHETKQNNEWLKQSYITKLDYEEFMIVKFAFLS